MEAFTDFILQVTYPPNPNRALEQRRSPGDQQAGRQLLRRRQLRHPVVFWSGNCAVPHLHQLPHDQSERKPRHRAPASSARRASPASTFQTQLFKMPSPAEPLSEGWNVRDPQRPRMSSLETNGFKGDQVRGFGFNHDGAIDTIFRFHHWISFSEVFTGPGNSGSGDAPEGNASAAADRGVRAGVSHQPRADRGPADHAHGIELRGGGGRASASSASAPTRASAIWSRRPTPSVSRPASCTSAPASSRSDRRALPRRSRGRATVAGAIGGSP